MTSRRLAASVAASALALGLAGCATTTGPKQSLRPPGAKPVATAGAAAPVGDDIRQILAAGGVDPGKPATSAPAAAAAAQNPDAPGPLPAVPTPAVARAALGETPQIPVAAAPPAPQAGPQPDLATNTAAAAVPVKPQKSPQAAYMGDFNSPGLSGFLPPPPPPSTQIINITGPDAVPAKQQRSAPAPARAVVQADQAPVVAASPRVVTPQAPVEASSLPAGFSAERKVVAPVEEAAPRRF